jgi:Acyltransferase family
MTIHVAYAADANERRTELHGLRTPPGERGGRIGYLDGWRGIAIVLVLLGHFAPVDAANLGTLGVDFFFVLSGRLMAEILFIKRVSLPAFYLRRFSRVYPGLLAFVVLAALFFHSTPIHAGILAVLSALTFLFTCQGNTKESPPMPRSRSSAKPKLLVDELGPTLDQQCAAYLAKGLPPDATEFDRMCFEAMAAFVRISTKPPKPDTETR